MSMKMTGAYVLAADRQTVWSKLNDAAVLKACIPGCQELEKQSDTQFSARAKVKIGPVSATFKGKVQLTDLDPPNSYRIVGEGEGGVAGFAKGGALVSLSPHASGTKLVYDVDAMIGGKIAQLGARLINAASKKFADEFFANLADVIGRAERDGANLTDCAG